MEMVKPDVLQERIDGLANVIRLRTRRAYRDAQVTSRLAAELDTLLTQQNDARRGNDGDSDS